MQRFIKILILNNFFYVGSYDEKIDNGMNLPSAFCDLFLTQYTIRSHLSKDKRIRLYELTTILNRRMIFLLILYNYKEGFV